MSFLYQYPPAASVTISTPPLQFLLDGIATDVSQDTAVPANSEPLPARILDSNGVPVNWSLLSKTFSPLATVFLDFSVTNVTDAAYVQLLASVGATASQKVQIFMSSGDPLYLAFGAAAAEVNRLIIIPGGNGFIDLEIPAGTRLSVRAINAGTTVNSGNLMINLLG